MCSDLSRPAFSFILHYFSARIYHKYAWLIQQVSIAIALMLNYKLMSTVIKVSSRSFFPFFDLCNSFRLWSAFYRFHLFVANVSMPFHFEFNSLFRVLISSCNTKRNRIDLLTVGSRCSYILVWWYIQHVHGIAAWITPNQWFNVNKIVSLSLSN